MEWLAAGKLPWSCMSWNGLDAEGLAEKRREKRSERLAKKRRRQGISTGRSSTPSHRPHIAKVTLRFWSATLWINWEANDADERRRHGAQAFGIKVSREHLLALLPEESREREQVRGACAWIAAEAGRMKAADKIPPEIEITDFARELESRMRKAAASDKSLRPITGEASRIGSRSGASGRLPQSNS